jgi:hypothetical protein
MNERLKELAEQAGFMVGYNADAQLERFAELVRQDEREACANLIDRLAYDSSYPYALRYAAQSLRNHNKG